MILLTVHDITDSSWDYSCQRLASPCSDITLASVALNAWEDPLKIDFLLNLLVLLTLLLDRYREATLVADKSGG